MASCVSARSLLYAWRRIFRRRKHSWNTSRASLTPTLSNNRTPFTNSNSASRASLHSSNMFFSKLHSRFWHVPMTPSLTGDSFMAFLHWGHAKAEKQSLLFSISSSLQRENKNPLQCISLTKEHLISPRGEFIFSTSILQLNYWATVLVKAQQRILKVMRAWGHEITAYLLQAVHWQVKKYCLYSSFWRSSRPMRLTWGPVQEQRQ